MVLKNCFPINFILKYIEFDYINLYLCIEHVKLFSLKITRLNHFGRKNYVEILEMKILN
jgi:hypothetical protein